MASRLDARAQVAERTALEVKLAEHERRAALRAIVIAAARSMHGLHIEAIVEVAVHAVGQLGFTRARFVGFHDDLDPDVDDYDRRIAARVRVGSGTIVDGPMVATPIVWNSAAGGALVASHAGVELSATGDPIPIEIEAIELVAADAGRAIEHAALAAELRASEARFRALVQGSSDLISVVDPDTTIRYQSPSDQTFGFHAEEMLGIRLADLVHPDDAPRLVSMCADLARFPEALMVVEFRAGRRDGTWVHLEASARNLLADPNVHGLVLSTRNVTERRALEDQLHHRAFHDPLTNLANRALFQDRVGHALVRTNHTSDRVAVLFLDLDSFKTVNDSLGHAAGDQLLMEVAHRLSKGLRRSDTIGRLGGDEFAILIEDVSSLRPAARVADEILDILKKPFNVAGKEVTVHASIGIALSEAGAVNADELLRNADVAMYQAKAMGKGTHCLFESSMHEAAVERLELEGDLRRAIERNELALHYQPIVDLGTSRLAGVEALVRWHHPERGLLGPDSFIPIAEDSGIILALGRWVLHDACATIAGWQDAAPGLSLAVNLSARHFAHPALLQDVSDALQSSGLDPALLTVEITESVLIRETESVLSKLFHLKQIGIRLALDDFGTGYSSLGYLRRFPIDVLKVDRSFVEGIALGVEESAVARAIIKLGRTLRIATIAEGVESVDQERRLQLLHCDLAQGYYYSRALEPDAMRALLDLPPTKLPWMRDRATSGG